MFVEGTTLVSSHVYTIVGLDDKGNIGVRNAWGIRGIEHISPNNFVKNFSFFFRGLNMDSWTRSYFLVIDDTLENPGVGILADDKKLYGGASATRHDFTITSDID